MAEIAGLKLITPSSVAGSGVSVSASGKVTFTAATAININGCFTSSYDNYLIVCRVQFSAGNAAMRARLRLSETDATGPNYVRQLLAGDGTTISASRISSLDYMTVGYLSASLRNGFHTYLYGPNLAQPTAQRTVYVSGASNALIGDEACTHSLATAYDGITLYPPSDNVTGSLTIYGLSQ